MFSSLTQPKYPQAALGLESETVTALALQKEGRNQFGIKQAATIELPTNLLVPNFLEKNIANVEELRVLLDEAVMNAGLGKQKRWSVALPSNTARTAILTLDTEPASKEELAEVLDWKSEQVFGASAGDLRITRQKISSDRDGKARYFATAVKLAIIDEYETLFETQGWQAGLILPRAVGESNWLIDTKNNTDALLISSQTDGFTALLMRGDEPTVVRTVTCAENERDDEIFRLLMFYRDRLTNENHNVLEKLLLIGKDFIPAKIREISAEALGKAVDILRPEDVGLNIPAANLRFDDIAAPAGLAALGLR